MSRGPIYIENLCPAGERYSGSKPGKRNFVG